MTYRIHLYFCLVFCLPILLQCNTPDPVQTGLLDTTPRLAVVSAFEPELDQLLKKTVITGTHTVNGHTYHLGRLADNDVVLFLSGVSMVNATIYTQMALDYFQIQGIVFSGIAGGVNPDLHVGDVVVPAQWGQYQEQIFARETGNGWDLGTDSDALDNFDMMFPRRVRIRGRKGNAGLQERRLWFPADTTMLAVAGQIAHTVQLQRSTTSGDSLQTRPSVLVGGYGVSGPTFVNNAAYRDWVWDTFQANALDMESAAVAHVAYANAIPYIVFRSLSDLAGGSPDGNQIRVFFKLAADNSAAVVEAFLAAWAKSKAQGVQ